MWSPSGAFQSGSRPAPEGGRGRAPRRGDPAAGRARTANPRPPRGRGARPRHGRRRPAPRSRLEELFQKPIAVTDTTEMFMSNDVYFALQQCGFDGAFMEGRDWHLGWREPTHVYQHPLQRLKLLVRHHALSDDVGYRFSNRYWNHWPLMAGTYAGWVRETWGVLVMEGWDFETFGEHHRRDSGIFEFTRALGRP